ncbi:hypothetical protein J7K99_01605 [bacterium]|nr:hypothetical protein [bacterium]
MKSIGKIVIIIAVICSGIIWAQTGDTTRMVFSYSTIPDSLTALRMGGYGGFGGAQAAPGSRMVLSYQLVPDSITALRVAGFGGFGGVETGGSLYRRGVISFSLTPDSLVALRVGGFGASGGTDVDELKSGRYVLSYSIVPDSLVALRVGGYGFPAAEDIDHSAKSRTVFSFSIAPDSLVALRVGGWGFSPGVSMDETAQVRVVFSFCIAPDSLVALRVGGFGTDTGGIDYAGRTRWVFSYGLPSAIVLTVISVPPGAALSVDTVDFVTESTFVWTFPDSHYIETDTLQRVFDGAYWYHFKFWLTAGGDTLWNPDTLIYISCSDTFTVYFSYEPTPKVLLKDDIWFDPYGEKRSFMNPLSPVEP